MVNAKEGEEGRITAKGRKRKQEIVRKEVVTFPLRSRRRAVGVFNCQSLRSSLSDWRQAGTAGGLRREG